MGQSTPYRIQSISEIHKLLGLPKPHHPLIGAIDLTGLKAHPEIKAVLLDFYVISLK